MDEIRVDRIGQSEAVLSFHLHQELDHLKRALLDPRWFPSMFHPYLKRLEDWKLFVEPSTAALIDVHVRISLHGRLRSYRPDLIMFNSQHEFIIAVELETTCSIQTLVQVSIYDGLCKHVIKTTTMSMPQAIDIFMAIKPFVLALSMPSPISEALHREHVRLLDLLDSNSQTFIPFPLTSVLGRLQAIVNQDDVTLLEDSITTSELTALNKIFIVQNILVHGSDVMKTAIEDLERKGLLDIESMEQMATKELPPQYMKYFTPEQLRGLTPEQLRGLTPEQLRGLTPEQLRGLTPEQLRGLTPEQLRGLTPEQLRGLTPEQLRGLTPEQLRGLTPEQLRGLTPEQHAIILERLVEDPVLFKLVFIRLSKETRRRLMALLQEAEDEDE